MRQSPNRKIGTLLARNWWTLAVRGIIAILFGIALFLLPGITVGLLVMLFGAFVLGSGILALVAAFRYRDDETRLLLILEGILAIVIGLLTIFWPGITAYILLYFIAAWAIVTGIFEIFAAIQLRKEIDNEWLLAVMGIASLLFGIVLAVRPDAGALAILWLLGTYAIAFGITLIILALRLRNWNRPQPPVI